MTNLPKAYSEYRDGDHWVRVYRQRGAVWVEADNIYNSVMGFRVPDAYVNDFNQAVNAALTKPQDQYYQSWDIVGGIHKAGLRMRISSQHQLCMLNGIGAIGGTKTSALAEMRISTPTLAKIMQTWLIPDAKLHLPALWMAQGQDIMRLQATSTSTLQQTLLSPRS